MTLHNQRCGFFTAISICVVMLGGSVSAQAAVITNLGSVGSHGLVWRINNVGQVLGWDKSTGITRSPFLWSAQHGRHYIEVPADRLPITMGLNDAGTVVGWHSTDSYQDPRSFTWTNGAITEIPAVQSVRYIGNDGRMLARTETSPGVYQSCVYNPDTGAIKVLEPVGELHGFARSMNTSGLVVGAVSLGQNHVSDAVAWVDDVPITVPFGPGAPSEMNGFMDVNESGLAVGFTGWEGAIQPFLWSAEGGVVDLKFAPEGSPNITSYALNNLGQVVGSTRTGSEYPGEHHAWVYDHGKLMYLDDLLPEDSLWHLDTASDINDHGQIIGIGYHNGERRAYMLQIPGPATALLLLGGLIAPKRRRR